MDNNSKELLEEWDSIRPSPFGPPDNPGVYGIYEFNMKEETDICKYIGSSKNVRKRIIRRHHPYMMLFKLRASSDILIYSKTLETKDYVKLEKKLIKIIKPELNIAHNKS